MRWRTPWKTGASCGARHARSATTRAAPTRSGPAPHAAPARRSSTPAPPALQSARVRRAWAKTQRRANAPGAARGSISRPTARPASTVRPTCSRSLAARPRAVKPTRACADRAFSRAAPRRACRAPLAPFRLAPRAPPSAPRAPRGRPRAGRAAQASARASAMHDTGKVHRIIISVFIVDDHDSDK